MNRELIAQTRLENQSLQLFQIQQRQRDRPLAIAPTYIGRDPATGLRRFEVGDGSSFFGSYGSNTIPRSLVAFPGSLGVPGFATQRPT